MAYKGKYGCVDERSADKEIGQVAASLPVLARFPFLPGLSAGQEEYMSEVSRLLASLAVENDGLVLFVKAYSAV